MGYRDFEKFLAEGGDLPWAAPVKQNLEGLKSYSTGLAQQGLQEIVFYGVVQQTIERIRPILEKRRSELAALEAETAEPQADIDKWSGKVEAASHKRIPKGRADSAYAEIRLLEARLQEAKLAARGGEAAKSRMAELVAGMEAQLAGLEAVEKPGPDCLPGLRAWLAE